MTAMGSDAGQPAILTPDQRLRVFVSSTLQELAEERAAARKAIERLRLAPVMFELGARPHPPRDLYRAYLDQSHVFIGLYWERYGWVAPGEEISGLEDEYRLCGGRPKLIYIKHPAPKREPRLEQLLDRIRDDDHASYKPFSTPSELRKLIENDLLVLLTERFAMGSRAVDSISPPGETEPALPTGTVTFLLTDVEGSTRLWEQSPEGMQQAMVRHDALVEHIIDQYAGQLVRPHGEGGSRFAVFARASDAVAAATALQQALSTEPWTLDGERLAIRMALHTGEAELRGGDYYGSAVNRCARLRSLAHGGQALLSFATVELVREALPSNHRLLDLGTHRLRDLTRPEHVFQLVIPELPSEFPALRSLESLPTNLPVQRNPLVGRERELTQVTGLLQQEEVGLVTLTGPGGTGKTRLALQVAAELLDAFPDGVYFVNLAPISDPALVVPTIAQTLGLRDEGDQPLLDRLHTYLQDKQLLLMLDNFEQVVEATEAVDALCQATPRLKLLVTSRVPLHLYGEREFHVPPLTLPARGHLPPVERLTQYGAVRLFIERAQAVKAGFQVTNDNAPAVAEICARLDGLPLAIELAAARIKLLPPQALLARLENRLNLLTGGARNLPARQQTLRAAIDWSYDLLDAGEKALFSRLAVFVGGRTLEAIEAVCDADGDLPLDTFDGVASLVDESLLVQEEGPQGEPRFVTLATIHEYAQEKLQASGEADALQQAHASYFLALAEAAEPHLIGAEQVAWLERLETEHDNLRASLRRTVASGESEVALRIAGALWRFWLVRGHLSEGRAWLTQLLAKPEALAHTEAVAQALNGAGALAWTQGEYAAARASFEACLAIRRELDDKSGVARSLSNVALVASDQGDYASARSLLQESLEMHRHLDDRVGLANTLNNLGTLASEQGDYTAARGLYEESLTLRHEMNDTAGIATSLLNLGDAAYYLGDYPTAQRLHEESLDVARQLGDKPTIVHALNSLGNVAYQQGSYAAARAWYEQSLTITMELDNKFGTASALSGLGLVAYQEGDVGSARTQLEESLTTARVLGQKWMLAGVLTHLGFVMHQQGDAEGAWAMHAESLALRRDIGDRAGTAASIEQMAALALSEGNSERAAHLWGAAEMLRSVLKVPLPASQRPRYEGDVAAARERLGDSLFRAMWNEGRAMSLEQTIAYALEASSLSGAQAHVSS
ncbi:MAG TPA: tetratricopeptide repeat protein [Ardenticatenaceae bacterium]